MTFSSPRSIAACWIVFAMAAGLLLGTSTLRTWMLFVMAAFIPAGVLVTLWTDGPPLTVAEVLHRAERRR